LRQNAWPKLAVITHQAREFTRASGAAIALTEPNGAEITCCARSGVGVPELGTALLVEGSLTALCIESGEQFWRDDAEADAGAHFATVVERRVRSVVVTPIQQAEQVLGALVVVATWADAFSEMHRVRLQTTADEIAAVLEEIPQPAQDRTPRLVPPIEPRAPEPVVNKPKPSIEPRLPSPERAAGFEEPGRAANAEVEPIGAKADVTHHHFATLDSMGRQPKKWPAGKLTIAGAATLLVIAGGVIWVSGSRPGSSLPDSPSKAQLSQNAVPAAGGAAGLHSSTVSLGHQAILKLEPGPVTAQLGSTFVLKVVCSQGQDISAVAAQVNYDSNILQFVAVSGGEFLSQDGEQVALVHRDDPATGALKINAQRPPGSAGVSGNGTVFSLMFLAKAKGASVVSLVTPEAGNSQGQNAEGLQVSVTVN